MNTPAFTARETLSVAGTAVPLTATIYNGNHRHVVITVEGVPIRFTVDGTTPTATLGHLAYPDDILQLKNQDQIRKFKAITPSGATATLMVSYGVK